MDPPPKESVKEKTKYFENFELKQGEPEECPKMSRKREIRKRYPGYACSCCKDYYKCLELNDKDLKVRLKKVSRHRGRSPPKTPEHFWELEFPDEEECLRRGYIEPPQPYYFKKKGEL